MSIDTIIGVIIGAITGIVTAIVAIRRSRVDIAKVSGEIYCVLIDELKEEREEQKKEILALRMEVAALRAEKAAWGSWKAEQQKLQRMLAVEAEITKLLQKKVADQQKEIKTLKRKVERLEKGDTGPLSENKE